jgi:dienelactone hydrolase
MFLTYHFASALDQFSDYSGKEIELENGLQAYLAQPSNPNGCAIISFPDIFEYSLARNFHCADQFACAGYFVLHLNVCGCDFIKGAVTAETIPAFVKKHDYATVIAPYLDSAIHYLKTTFEIEHFGAIGYCWGALNVFHACATGQPIEAAVVFHPSIGLNTLFGGKADCSDLAPKMKAAILMVATSNDPVFVKPEGATIVALQQTNAKSRAVEFTAQAHGFMNRGDTQEDFIKDDVKKAMTMAINFLNENFGICEGVSELESATAELTVDADSQNEGDVDADACTPAVDANSQNELDVDADACTPTDKEVTGDVQTVLMDATAEEDEKADMGEREEDKMDYIETKVSRLCSIKDGCALLRAAFKVLIR